MKKIKTAIVALSYMFCSVVSNAQEQQLTLKCEQIGEIKGEQKFSAEDGWLMLTTDIYLLNPEAFKGQLGILPRFDDFIGVFCADAGDT